MDPDEFLKAKGADEYEKALENTVPLADLLWRKNVEAVAADTPEQKALFEKNAAGGSGEDCRRKKCAVIICRT